MDTLPELFSGTIYALNYEFSNLSIPFVSLIGWPKKTRLTYTNTQRAITDIELNIKKAEVNIYNYVNLNIRLQISIRDSQITGDKKKYSIRDSQENWRQKIQIIQRVAGFCNFQRNADLLHGHDIDQLNKH